MRLKFHKRSAVKFTSRIIPHAKPCGTILLNELPLNGVNGGLAVKLETLVELSRRRRRISKISVVYQARSDAEEHTLISQVHSAILKI